MTRAVTRATKINPYARVRARKMAEQDGGQAEQNSKTDAVAPPKQA